MSGSPLAPTVFKHNNLSMDNSPKLTASHLRPLVAAIAILAWGFGPSGSAAEEAPDTQDSGFEINLDALKDLDEENAPPPQDAAPDTKAEENNTLPALTPTPEPVQKQPLPQSPSAPQAEPTTSLAPSPTAVQQLDSTVVTLLFEEGIENLSLNATDQLDQVAAQINNTAIRLQLFAYAGLKNDSPSTSRRLALRRAIAARGYLMDKGINGTRIDLRPMGPETGDKAPERVDVTLVVP